MPMSLDCHFHHIGTASGGTWKVQSAWDLIHFKSVNIYILCTQNIFQKDIMTIFLDRTKLKRLWACKQRVKVLIKCNIGYIINIDDKTRYIKFESANTWLRIWMRWKQMNNNLTYPLSFGYDRPGAEMRPNNPGGHWCGKSRF